MKIAYLEAGPLLDFWQGMRWVCRLTSSRRSAAVPKCALSGMGRLTSGVYGYPGLI